MQCLNTQLLIQSHWSQNRGNKSSVAGRKPHQLKTSLRETWEEDVDQGFRMLRWFVFYLLCVLIQKEGFVLKLFPR